MSKKASSPKKVANSAAAANVTAAPSNSNPRIPPLPPQGVVTKGTIYLGKGKNGRDCIMPCCDSEEYQPSDPDFYIPPSPLSTLPIQATKKHGHKVPGGSKLWGVITPKGNYPKWSPPAVAAGDTTPTATADKDWDASLLEANALDDELERAMELMGISEAHGMSAIGDIGLSFPEGSRIDPASEGEEKEALEFALKIVNFSWEVGPLAEGYEKTKKTSYAALLKEAGLLPKTATEDVDDETLSNIRGTKFRMKPVTAEEIYEMEFARCDLESLPIRQYTHKGGAAEFIAVTEAWKHETITRSLVSEKRQQRGLLIQAFLAAAQLGDIPSLYHFYQIAKDIAARFSMWALFGFALERYCDTLADATDWNHLGRIQDLVYFSVSAGEAFEAAGLPKSAILNYKRAALASVSGEGPISEDYPAMTWNCLGLALKRQGEYVMAARAYQTSLVYVPSNDKKLQQQNTLQNMRSLWEVMYLPSDLRLFNHKGGDKESIQRQIEKGAQQHTYASLHSCANCGKMAKDTKKCGAWYCSKECSKADWAKHKKVCGKPPTDEAAV